MEVADITVVFATLTDGANGGGGYAHPLHLIWSLLKVIHEALSSVIYVCSCGGDSLLVNVAAGCSVLVARCHG